MNQSYWRRTALQNTAELAALREKAYRQEEEDNEAFRWAVENMVRDTLVLQVISVAEKDGRAYALATGEDINNFHVVELTRSYELGKVLATYEDLTPALRLFYSKSSP